ncbi:MAG: hypothetical protein JXB26_07490 [Candidatus Aminicenantes bacterium]|nr:hypothetical protein [Candidatus Aminicenantes bacterium]
MTINIRERIKTEIFDYQTLIDALKELSCPRDKITDLIKKGIIIRIKKGLYIFGDRYRSFPYSKELLANLIFGPSYISLDYALDYYGLIPERVEALTSVTIGRSRKFHTPVGLFIFRQIPPRAYQTGISLVEEAHGQSFMIALPEKALSDKIFTEKGIPINSQKEMHRFLVEDLRIEISAIESLSLSKINEYANLYRSRKLRFLSSLVKRLQKSRKDILHE